jgi:hypothetical protein
MRAFDRDLIRGEHYGPRSCEPQQQAEHMAAPHRNLRREDFPCQFGAVHTWPIAAVLPSNAVFSFRAESGPFSGVLELTRLTLSRPFKLLLAIRELICEFDGISLKTGCRKSAMEPPAESSITILRAPAPQSFPLQPVVAIVNGT